MKSIKEEYEYASQNTREVEADPWRLHYHLMPPIGWMNDPNGLCQFKDIYHIFYQYAPLSAEGKALKGWGHYSTKDFVHYHKEDVALVPDSSIDSHGAYSGCAWVENDQIQFFYTGNIKFEGDFDYINNGRGHYVNTFSSKDGIYMSEKKNVLKNIDYPHDLSCHVRDPKIYKENDMYYMVLGARTLDSVGCVLIYKSHNLQDWQYLYRLYAKEPFGYMWECPDLFEINNQKVLVTCPQGVSKDGYKYENVYANGYFLLEGDIENMKVGEFIELDHGFDFYAPQTFLDNQNRRILIGWMGLPDIPYTNPTVEKGWQHALTLPRELTFKDNRIYQYPIQEILSLKKQKKSYQAKPEHIIHHDNVVCECHITELPDEWTIQLRQDIKISYYQQVFTLSLEKSGYGRDARHVEIESIEELNIFSDTSSLEIFINHGQEVLSTRVYDDMTDMNILSNQPLHIDIYDMQKFIYE